jgi:tetratricopeptide (TPR) repeat protein
MLEKLGGSIDANAATLAQLLGTVKGQAATLRKQQKPDEADKLVAAVGELFIKFAAKKDLSVKYQYFAAKSLNDLGQSSKAIDLLAGLPDAQPEDLAAKFNDLSDDKKNSVRTHRSAKLELAKAYRQTGQFAKAETVLEAAMGPEGKPGWAAKVLDYRREAILLLEARAAAADGKVMNELWAKANQAWGKLAREYGGVLTQPLPKDEEKKNEAIRNREQIKPVYFGLFADNQKCLVKANQMILKGKPEALDKRYDSIANAMKTVETQNPDLAVEVREKFAEILDETPALKKRYEATGGKMFLRNADGSLPGTDTNTTN